MDIEKEVKKNGCRDGKSREYDKDMNLVAVDGVKVKKTETKVATPHVKTGTGNQPTLKGGK